MPELVAAQEQELVQELGARVPELAQEQAAQVQDLAVLEPEPVATEARQV